MSSSAAPGELFIVSAPSGAGKTTLIQAMLAQEDPPVEGIAFSVSHTTRTPREGEVDGRDYHFVDRTTFEEMIARDRFIEHADVHGNLYGTSVDEVLPRLSQGQDVILDIDVQGAGNIRTHGDRVLPGVDRHAVLVLPPGFDELRRRLVQRNLDDEASIARRLAAARREVERFEEYDYVILNDRVERASRILASIILDKRHRTKRMRERVAAVLDDFHRAANH